jgi:hypothetical protein
MDSHLWLEIIRFIAAFQHDYTHLVTFEEDDILIHLPPHCLNECREYSASSSTTGGGVNLEPYVL